MHIFLESTIPSGWSRNTPTIGYRQHPGPPPGFQDHGTPVGYDPSSTPVPLRIHSNGNLVQCWYRSFCCGKNSDFFEKKHVPMQEMVWSSSTCSPKSVFSGGNVHDWFRFMPQKIGSMAFNHSRTPRFGWWYCSTKKKWEVYADWIIYYPTKKLKPNQSVHSFLHSQLRIHDSGIRTRIKIVRNVITRSISILYWYTKNIKLQKIYIINRILNIDLSK